MIHLAFKHDFSEYASAGLTDQLATEALGAALIDTGRPLVITSGTGVLMPGRIGTDEVGTEEHEPNLESAAAPRLAGEQVTLTLAAQGVRSSVLRLPPS